MILSKKFNFGLGTLLSLIIVYFVYLFSKDKGWALLAFLAKWYLIIVLVLFILPLAIILLIILLVSIFSILTFLFARAKFRKNFKQKKNKEYIDAEFKVKE